MSKFVYEKGDRHIGKHQCDMCVYKVNDEYLCQKLEIDVQKESDSLSEDDQMLLEYELEELEKANSGVADGGGAGGGESSSSSKKKKSDSDSDGSDFHIDNPTFSIFAISGSSSALGLFFPKLTLEILNTSSNSKDI